MATLYFRSTGTNWGTAGDWSTTASPTYTGGSVPTAADDVIFESASANCIVNTSNRVCKTINFTNYTNTITMTFNITVSGAITFGSSMNVSDPGTMIINSTGTITSNGYVWPNAFSFTGGITYTLASTTRFAGTTTFLTGTTTLNSNTLEVATLTATGSVTGTSNLTMYTTGTWSGGGTVFNNLTFNSAGTVTISGTVLKNGNTLTYTAGLLALTGSTLRIFGTAVSMLGFSGVIFNNLTIGVAGTGIVTTLTIDGDIDVAGILTLTSTTVNSACIIIGGTYNLYTNSLAVSAGVITPSTIIFNGSSGTWTQSGGFHNCNITVAGNVTLSTNINYGVNAGTNTLKYISGTFNPNSFQLSIFGGCQLDFNGASFYNVSIGGNGAPSQTVTLVSNLTLTNNLTLGGGLTPFTVNGNNINTGGNLTVTSAINYTGTTNIVLNGTGTWSHSTQPASFTIPVVINTSGTITLSGTITKNGNLTYTTGTITSTGSTLNWSGVMTINATGFNLGTLNLTGATLFDGSQGFTIHTLTCTTAGTHSIWKNGNEYIITDNFISGQVDANNRITYTSSLNRIFTGSIAGSVLTVTAVAYGTIAVGDEIFATGLTQGFTISSFGTGAGGTGTYNLSGAPGNLTSRTIVSTPGTASYPKLTLQNGAYQNLYYSNALDIDSTLGQTIWTFSSNLKRAFNWALGTRPTQRTFISVS